jgi:hypothetical protein
MMPEITESDPISRRTSMDRDKLGRVVRAAWITWALTQPDPKPSWLVPYDELPEPDKEADRQIGAAVFDHLNGRRIALAEIRSRGELSPAEAEEFAALQRGVFDVLEVMHPRPGDIGARLDAIEARLEAEVARLGRELAAARAGRDGGRHAAGEGG